MFHLYSILELLKKNVNAFFLLLAFCFCLGRAENWSILPFRVAFYSGKYCVIPKFVCLRICQLAFPYIFEKVQENSSVSGYFKKQMCGLF